MFDWDDQDQVGDSIWGEFPENEDDIVPYHKGTEENIVPILGNYSRKQKNEKVSTALGSSAQTSGPKNDILEINQDNSSTFITSEELSAAQLDVDSWPDLPSLSTTLGKEYNDPCNRDSMETQLMLDISGATNLDKIGVQLDSPSEIFANDKDEESDAFLDCDWANIGDIEDLDKIFSGNDSIFGHEMVGNAGEFLSASSDIISSTVPSIPLPDLPLSKDQPSVHDSSSFHLEKLSAGKETPEEKTADCTVGTGSKYYEAHNLFSNKSNSQKRPLRSHKKENEKVKTKDSQDTSAMWSCSTDESQQLLSSTMNPHTKTPMETFQPTVERQVRATNDIGQLPSPNQFMLSGYGYTAYPFRTIPLSQNVHSKKNLEKPLSIDYKVLTDFSKSSNALSRPPEINSRPLTMTPQEKIEKLRRRQQMQAMLAIQQQEQQFAHPSTDSESGFPQPCSPRKQIEESTTTSSVDAITNKLSSAEHNILADQEEPWKISTMIDDHSLEETIYYQFQDALGQLDIRIRLCIRDSLFRLARSAMERQSASDRSSTNKSNRDEDELSTYDETKRLNRSSKWPDAETGTNPIDRTVAHLLFHRPSELLARSKEEIPQSPVVYEPAPNASLQPQARKSDDCPEKSGGEMERQPSSQSKMY
ncbi:protein LNK2 isoform X2 [Canna indica]|uniref:Protein LNK2 isoform X2 n=1 Tax=Canna indica TaxID=4628 RepID=A0AAQ3KPL1_9LILI|nr:protein LNK2 isoform X2 [Canna indica]